MTLIQIAIVTGRVVKVPKYLEREQEVMEIGIQIEAIQARTLLILAKVDLLSLRFL